MCALAHDLEAAGIATSTIALIRPHAERIRPPRPLWVPFELGRPLGPPNDAGFQRAVLRAALGLLEWDDGPGVLADYPTTAPDAAEDPRWRCPIRLSAATLGEELVEVMPWYEQARARLGYSTVGVSGLPLAEAAEYLARLDGPRPMPEPRRDLASAQIMRFAADDLKACYLEAAAIGDGCPSSKQLARWLFFQTRVGARLFELRIASRQSDDPNRRLAANWLVPETMVEEAGLESFVKPSR